MLNIGISRHVWISFYLGVLSDDLVSLPLSEHQAVLASGYMGIDLFGHHSIWTSVCLGISLPDLDSDQDAHPSSMHDYRTIAMHRIGPSRCIGSDLTAEMSGIMPSGQGHIWESAYLGDLYLSIRLSGHRAILVSWLHKTRRSRRGPQEGK